MGGNRGNNGFNRRALVCLWRFQYGEVHLKEEKLFEKKKDMREFSNFIKDPKLLDTQLEDGQYTWFKGDNQDIASRIDRILISNEWDGSFNKIKQIALQRLGSDHNPITLLGECGTKTKIISSLKTGG